MNPEIQNLIREINQGETLRRTGTIERVVTRADDAPEAPEKISYRLSFSSEAPYERSFGMEILGHGEGEVEMDWIGSGRAPLLLQHDRDRQIGVVDSALISGGRGTASVRFGAGALAKEVQQDVDDGIRGNVSVGYEVLDMVMTRKLENGTPEYRVTKWRPREISIVSLPADETVGVGRAKTTEPKTFQTLENTPMSEQNAQQEAQRLAQDEVARERARVDGILSLGSTHRLESEAQKAIREGQSLADFQARALELLAKGHKPLGSEGNQLSRQEEKDLQKFSFLRALNGLMKGGKLDGIEAEMLAVGRDEAQRCGLQPSGLVIPYAVLSRGGFGGMSTRALAAASSALVQTDVLAGSFIDALRNYSVLPGLGAQYLEGLVGNVSIPRSSGFTATWEGEVDDGADGSPTLDSVTMSPKRVGGYVPVSKQLLRQSSLSVEAMLRNDIAISLALAIEGAALAGTGANGQPTGILYMGTNINNSDLGTDGGTLTWASIVNMEKDVDVDNALIGNLAYVTNAKVRAQAKQTVRVGSTDSLFIMADDGTMNGYPTAVTNALPSNLTKGTSSGTCSPVIFGNFRELLVGMWGGLDLVVDEYTLAHKTQVRIVGNMWADVAVRHGTSFCLMDDVITT